jgi:hypothetical protein
MSEFLVRGTQAEKKGAEDSCLPINIIDLYFPYICSILKCLPLEIEIPFEDLKLKNLENEVIF